MMACAFLGELEMKPALKLALTSLLSVFIMILGNSEQFSVNTLYVET